jgi:tRNA G46 methylase TrmB
MGLYNFTLYIIEEEKHQLLFSSDDIYTMKEPHEATTIQTFYEEKFRKEGIPIKYIEFSLNHES